MWNLQSTLFCPSSAWKALQKNSVDKKQTEIELQTQAVKDLDELLCCKTEQMSKYGHIPAFKSNYYRRHQMVQGFLWIQLNKEKNIIQLDWQDLAQIVAQSFNRQAYIGRKIVQGERSWVKDKVISSTQAGGNKKIFLWMEDEDLIFSGKEWTTKMSKSKYFSQYESISSINILSDITSYLLARFIYKYL